MWRWAGMPVGVQRNRSGEAQIKIGGRAVRTVAELAEQLPLQVITAESFGLLTGAPGARRRIFSTGECSTWNTSFSASGSDFKGA